jgi:hypothetical protein
MLRVTRAKDLNDPFELNPSEELLDFVIRAKKPSKDVMQLLMDKRNFFEYTTTWNKGVISLSECKDNLLMWSHYAKEHQGGVIEFSFDIEHQSHSRTPVQRGFFKYLADNNYQYDVVKYRKNRTIDTSLLTGKGYELSNQIIDSLAFVKSKDWMYEEEHRFLVDTTYCDITLVENTARTRQELEVLSLSPELINDQLVLPPEHKIKNPNSFMPQLNHFSFRSENMQFASIAEACVTGIYLGSKMAQTQRDNIFSLRHELSKFTNLCGNLYQAKIHPHSYDLNFEKIQNVCT